MLNFEILYKSITAKKANYYKLLVEVADGIWEEAFYFGNTTPKQVTKLSYKNDMWKVEIQKHTSRDRDTGKFTSFKRKEA